MHQLIVSAKWQLGLVLLLLGPCQVALAAVTGAVVDESSVKRTIVVDQSGQQPESVRTITKGLELALPKLEAGEPTRVVVHAGVYRETAAAIRFEQTARSTLLVIEAAPKARVVWSGSDELPEAGWTSEGEGLWSHPWDKDFGMYCMPWGVAYGVGPRREMLFQDGRPLKPVSIEDWLAEGLGPWSTTGVKWTYLGSKDPRLTLSEGEFGSTDNRDGGNRLYLRLAKSQKPRGIEAATRNRLLDIRGKSNLVLRGITFQHCANGEQDWGHDVPVFVGSPDESRCGDILIDRCQFVWNSGTGLDVQGWRWTIRDTQCNFNGFSGIAGGHVQNVLFQRVSTNWNCWREFLGGTEDWCYAGFKMAETNGHLVEDHTSIGNCDHGMWWDIFCGDITVSGATCLYNRRSMIYELSVGPFVASKVLAAEGYREPRANGDINPSIAFSCNGGQITLESSILITDTAPEVLGVQWYERQDGPQAVKKVIPDVVTVRNCVISGGPNTKKLVREANVGDRKEPGWKSLKIAGAGNTFFHPNADSKLFGYANINYTPLELTLAEWTKDRSDRDAKFMNPQFRNPAAGDYRFSPNSPLSNRSDLPQVQVSKDLLEETRKFHEWIGWPHLPKFEPYKAPSPPGS